MPLFGSKLRKIDNQGKQAIELPPLYMFDSLVLTLYEYFRMDFANEVVDPLSGKIDHPVGNNEDIALGSNLHSLKCPTCGGESSNYNTHQIHAEICKQVKSGKFKSPLSIEELESSGNPEPSQSVCILFEFN